MKTPFEKRPEREKRADSEKALRVVLRSGFNVDAYWKHLRRDVAEGEGKR